MADDEAQDDFVEKRKNGGLSDEQIAAIKEQLLASIYEDIGRSVVKKILWAGGAVFAALLAWAGANHVQIR